MGTTTIEWCDKVWNPVTGCTKVSEGCRNCYAERIARRFWGQRKFSTVQCHEDRLSDLAHWRKPSKIFVNSMSDLFHPDVPDEFIWKVFDTMTRGNRRHTYMILTKRPERMKKWFAAYQERFWNYHAPDQPQGEFVAAPWPDPCIWLGVSVEDQKAADERIPVLLDTPAAVRFVSCEPLLESVDLSYFLTNCSDFCDEGYVVSEGEDDEGEPIFEKCSSYEWCRDFGFNSNGLDWVIAGGESGPSARPIRPDWVRFLRDQCQSFSVPFFFKGWGGTLKQKVVRIENGEPRLIQNRMIDGREWNEFPEVKR